MNYNNKAAPYDLHHWLSIITFARGLNRLQPFSVSTELRFITKQHETFMTVESCHGKVGVYSDCCIVGWILQ